MTRNPQVAAMITSLTIFPIEFFGPRRSSSQPIPEPNTNTPQSSDISSVELELLRSAFEALPNLKYLNLEWDHPLGMDFAIGTVLDGASFKLETFLCHCTQDWDIYRFLSGQTELKTSGWRSIGQGLRPIPSFQPGDLPHLRSIFNMSSGVFDKVVAGRPICRVQQCIHIPNLPLSLSRSMKKIEVLFVARLPTDQGLLEDFKRHLSHLRYLGCFRSPKNVNMLFPFLNHLASDHSTLLHA